MKNTEETEIKLNFPCLTTLSREQYTSLLESGLFWERYPEATGYYEIDCNQLTLRDYVKLDVPSLVNNLRGFKVSKGKKVYYYAVRTKKDRWFKCFSIEDSGMLGWPVNYPSNKRITLVFKPLG